MKNVLIFKGSMQSCGNAATLADEFARGAVENGNTVNKVILKEKNVKDCLGCGACQVNGGTCIQNDDMSTVYVQMIDADVIVFASPVYFYTWTSLMKRVIDRTFAIEGLLKDKSFYLLSAGAAPEENYMRIMTESFNQYVSCFRAGGNSVGGIVYALGTNKPNDAIGSEAAAKAYKMGKEI